MTAPTRQGLPDLASIGWPSERIAPLRAASAIR
jgi:hypothetical protein